MFSGIIETIAQIKTIKKEGSNIHFELESKFTSELKVDQSIAHNGVCLTVTEINGNCYWVTAIQETLDCSAMGDLKEGDKVNFERCIRLNDRLDGHIVQGHVDGTATVLSVENMNGSWEYHFELDSSFENINGYPPQNLIIHKGSITINGTSLTVTFVKDRKFGVAIIPYTYDNTVFHTLQQGDKVNIELDVLGKYVARLKQA